MQQTEHPVKRIYGQRVLIVPDEQKTFVRGLHHSQTTPPAAGTVLMVGGEVDSVSEGDRVAFYELSGTTIFIGEGVYRLMSVSDLMMDLPKGVSYGLAD